MPAPPHPLDKHILRLLALHKALAAKFPSPDLAKMDDAGKQAFLGEMQRFLGIEPPAFRSP